MTRIMIMYQIFYREWFIPREAHTPAVLQHDFAMLAYSFSIIKTSKFITFYNRHFITFQTKKTANNLAVFSACNPQSCA